MIDDIRYLIVFAKIAEVGSISGGAKALGISTATASQHLTRLEHNLDTALLYRNTRKLSLSPAGAELLDTAQAMLALYEKGVIEFKQRAVSTQQSLRISMPALFINSAFSQHLATFIQDHPDLRMSISCDDSRHDIIADGIDVAFRIGELPDSSLKARHLCLLPRRVVASPGYLAQHGPLQHPGDLASLDWIGLSMRPDARQFHHRHTGEQASLSYTSRVRVDSVEASHRMALLGVGLAAPPDFLCAGALAAGELVAVLPDWALEPLKVYAVWPPNIATSSLAYRLINTLYNAFNGQALA
ncbi:LysR family transcriptional regulator [Pseudomonas sp. RP23018S]|uniref:LysR family transcriptional regulator n=1 Tax=Pseudomonas sp. RP23018S TaxID=3096037 RepID=UPI002ACA520A|nr:LysR family transcriptional regulator [Pseudomonas sp. RP23018S]MDZ5605141.1 LysR family transcriptional regulator [Pseudomonas sp. RP23018S]